MRGESSPRRAARGGCPRIRSWGRRRVGSPVQPRGRPPMSRHAPPPQRSPTRFSSMTSASVGSSRCVPPCSLVSIAKRHRHARGHARGDVDAPQVALAAARYRDQGLDLRVVWRSRESERAQTVVADRVHGPHGEGGDAPRSFGRNEAPLNATDEVWVTCGAVKRAVLDVAWQANLAPVVQPKSR